MTRGREYCCTGDEITSQASWSIGLAPMAHPAWGCQRWGARLEPRKTSGVSRPYCASAPSKSSPEGGGGENRQIQFSAMWTPSESRKPPKQIIRKGARNKRYMGTSPLHIRGPPTVEKKEARAGLGLNPQAKIERRLL